MVKIYMKHNTYVMHKKQNLVRILGDLVEQLSLLIKRTLLTNNHVVDGCTLSKISYKNKDYDTKLIATDKTLDLALLKAELKPKTFLNFSKDEAKKLNTIYVAGYPLGKGLSDDLKISSGIVSSLKGLKITQMKFK